ncbi:MAG: PAS domain-containing protein [Anaerolineales bacterium]|nr:PAS domain-containing protein [Anaerolineales bacterium]
MNIFKRVWHRLDALFSSRKTVIASQQLHDFLDQLNDWIFSINNQGQITWVNLKICEDFGEPRDVFIDQTPWQFIQGYMKEIAPTMQAVFSGKQISPFELELVQKDGTPLQIYLQSTHLAGDEPIYGTYYVARDVSIRKQSLQMDDQKTIEHLKDVLLSNISHELRTPITNLKLYHDLIRRNPAKQDVYLAHIEKEINRLHQIIDELLNFVSLEQERNKAEYNDISLNEIISEQVAQMQVVATQKNLTLQIIQEMDLPLVQGNKKLLGQALNALLTNAINYTPENGRIIVSTATAWRDEKQWIGVKVRDNGYGISNKDLPHIFKRFYRGEAGQLSRAPGTGLGLALVKEIIDQHKGQLTVENIESKEGGTCFSFWLAA